jgi:hypothetical protein
MVDSKGEGDYAGHLGLHLRHAVPPCTHSASGSTCLSSCNNSIWVSPHHSHTSSRKISASACSHLLVLEHYSLSLQFWHRTGEDDPLHRQDYQLVCSAYTHTKRHSRINTFVDDAARNKMIIKMHPKLPHLSLFMNRECMVHESGCKGLQGNYLFTNENVAC